MKWLYVIGYSLFFIFLIIDTGLSQELISPAGDVFSIENLQWEWSIGETVIDTYAGENIFTQGFHQPDVKSKPKDEINCAVYPNPYDMFLILKISKLESEHMFCQIIDVCGKVVLNMRDLKVYNEFITGDMSDGVYILRVYDSKSRLLKTVKIVKLYQT